MAKDDNVDADNKNDKNSPKDDEQEKPAEDGETREKIHEQIDEVIMGFCSSPCN